MKKTSNRLFVMVMASFLVIGVGDCYADKNKESFPTIVETKYGKVQGYYNTDTTVAWKSVPFAKPPVGDLRWKAPQNPDRWRGVLDATQECAPCAQLLTNSDWTKEPVTVGSEDCLYLDIYRPQNRRRHLPVYVYFHGGSNHFGDKSYFDGSKIAEKSNMVVVVVQQRLGPLGWFTHPSLRHGVSPADDSGNFGTLDNIKALQWIRGNICAFGGNPSNVTITGESAGAHNVMNMVISPLAKGLFHRAMSQSGGMVTDTVAEGEAMAEQQVTIILASQGIALELWNTWPRAEQEAFLQSLDATEIWVPLYEILKESLTYDAFQDGYVIPGSVVSTIRSGDYNKVPIILGANKSETKTFMPLFGPDVGMPWADLIDVLDGLIPLEAVFTSEFDIYLYNITGYYGSRNWRGKFVDELARALKERQNDVYAYQFNWGEPGSGPYPFNIIYGAYHSLEISFFFGTNYSTIGYGFDPDNDTAGRQALSDAMMTYLGNFARHGNPNGRGGCESDLPEWQEWSNEADAPKTILFDSDLDNAIISMSNEEVLIDAEKAKLEAELACWPPETEPLKEIVRAFQWHEAE